MTHATLAATIREAFRAVTLGNGMGLREAQAVDDYADAQTRAAHRDADEKEDWQRIPGAELNRCNSSLSFFDAEGMRFHLPAFLLADLRGEYRFGLTFALNPKSDYARNQFALLSASQRGAVRAFLLYMRDEREFDRDEVDEALRYWAEQPS